jgi:hypothetical protein
MLLDCDLSVAREFLAHSDALLDAVRREMAGIQAALARLEVDFPLHLVAVAGCRMRASRKVLTWQEDLVVTRRTTLCDALDLLECALEQSRRNGGPPRGTMLLARVWEGVAHLARAGRGPRAYPSGPLSVLMARNDIVLGHFPCYAAAAAAECPVVPRPIVWRAVDDYGPLLRRFYKCDISDAPDTFPVVMQDACLVPSSRTVADGVHVLALSMARAADPKADPKMLVCRLRGGAGGADSADAPAPELEVCFQTETPQSGSWCSAALAGVVPTRRCPGGELVTYVPALQQVWGVRRDPTLRHDVYSLVCLDLRSGDVLRRMANGFGTFFVERSITSIVVATTGALFLLTGQALAYVDPSGCLVGEVVALRDGSADMLCGTLTADGDLVVLCCYSAADVGNMLLVVWYTLDALRAAAGQDAPGRCHGLEALETPGTPGERVAFAWLASLPAVLPHLVGAQRPVRDGPFPRERACVALMDKPGAARRWGIDRRNFCLVALPDGGVLVTERHTRSGTPTIVVWTVQSVGGPCRVTSFHVPTASERLTMVPLPGGHMLVSRHDDDVLSTAGAPLPAIRLLC